MEQQLNTEAIKEKDKFRIPDTNLVCGKYDSLRNYSILLGFFECV